MKIVADSRDRAAWLAARQQLVTASDVARMLGCGWAKNDEDKAHQRGLLRTEKAFGAAESAPEHMKPGEHLIVARYMEPSVLEYARCEMGWKVEHSTGLYVSDVCPLLGATVDGVRIDDDGVECDVEVKVSGAPATEDCSPSGEAMMRDGPPVHWTIQNQAQMAVSGRTRGYILVLHHFDRKLLKVREYRNDRHDGVIAKILADVPVFWSEVETLRSRRMAV